MGDGGCCGWWVFEWCSCFLMSVCVFELWLGGCGFVVVIE